MNDRPTPKQEAALLAWVNQQRKELGREPVDRLSEGYRGVACGCPISASIGPGTAVYDEDGDRAYWESADRRFDSRACPAYVTTFIRRFDAGEYPGLEVGR